MANIHKGVAFIRRHNSSRSNNTESKEEKKIILNEHIIVTWLNNLYYLIEGMVGDNLLL